MDGRPLSSRTSQAPLHQLEECNAFGGPDIPFSFSRPPPTPSQGLHCYPFGFDIAASYTESICASSSSAPDFCNDLGTDVYLECDQWLTDGAENEDSIDPKLTENEVARQCVVSRSVPLFELSPGTESTVIRAVTSGFLAPTYVNNVRAGHASDLYYRTVLPTAQQEVHTENAKEAVTDKGLILLQNKIGAGAISKTEFYRENDIRMWRKKRSRQGLVKELTSGASRVAAIDMAPSPSDDRLAFRVKTANPYLNDGFLWLKYGQKKINDEIHPRSYLKCKWRGGGPSPQSACKVVKRVQRCSDDEDYVLITYLGRHNHRPPRP